MKNNGTLVSGFFLFLKTLILYNIKHWNQNSDMYSFTILANPTPTFFLATPTPAFFLATPTPAFIHILAIIPTPNFEAAWVVNYLFPPTLLLLLLLLRLCGWLTTCFHPRSYSYSYSYLYRVNSYSYSYFYFYRYSAEGTSVLFHTATICLLLQL